MKQQRRALIVMAAVAVALVLAGCPNPTASDGGGGGGSAGSSRPDTLGGALSFMERFPDSVGNKYLSSGSVSGSMATATVSVVNESQAIDGPRTPADYLYDEVGWKLDMFAWLDRENAFPAPGASSHLGSASASRFADGTTLGDRISAYLTERVIGPDGSFDLGIAEAVSTSSGYNIYVTYDNDGTTRYLYFIVEEQNGEIASVAYHEQNEFTGDLPVNGSLTTGTYPTESFGRVSWSTDGVPTFDFVKFFDRNKDGIFFEADDPGSVLRSTVGNNEVDMVLSTREAGLAYRTTSGLTQFAGMYATTGGGTYTLGYFDPSVAGSFDDEGGFQLYLFDSAGGYLGEGQTYNLADTSTLPTSLSSWDTRWLAFGSDSVSFSSAYSGDTLLWDDNGTVASTSDTNHEDDAYWIDVNANSVIDTGTDVQVGGGTGNTQTVARTRPATIWFSEGLPVVTITNPEFGTYFSWALESNAEAWLDSATSYLSSSAIGIGPAVDTDEGDIEGFMQEVIDTVPAFPAVGIFPALP